MNLEQTLERLDIEKIEYVVTELEPVDGSKNRGLGTDLPAHIVQYYTKSGDDIVTLVVGDQSKVVCLSGYFHTPIQMRSDL